MSGFKLDIDYPYDMAEATTIASKPEPMAYPMKRIPVRHYGTRMFEVFDKLKTMEKGREYDELVRLAANQMKRDLVQRGHGSTDDEKVASDLAGFTDGRVQLDLSTFRFDRVEVKEQERRRGKKR